MDTVIFVELLGRHGEVLHRQRLAALPATVGRAYDNDVILDDPFVAPHHARIERSGEGTIEIVDLGTVNGLRAHGARERLERMRMGANGTCLIGRTQLRVRSGAFEVPPERPETRGGALPAWAIAGGLVAVMVAVSMLDAWASTFETPKPRNLVLPALLLAGGLCTWAGAWAFVGRIFVGEARFARHAAAAAVFVLALFAWEALVQITAFALSARAAAHALDVIGFGVLVAALTHHHLGLATRAPARRRLVAAAALGLFLGGTLQVLDYSREADDLAHMEVLDTIMTPAVRIVPGRNADAFFAAAEELVQDLERMRGGRK